MFKQIMDILNSLPRMEDRDAMMITGPTYARLVVLLEDLRDRYGNPLHPFKPGQVVEDKVPIPGPLPSQTTEEFFTHVAEIIKDRTNQYGDFEKTLHNLAKLWEWYLTLTQDKEIYLSKEHAGMMMILLKVVRESMKHSDSNLEDICGYTEGVRRCNA